jgi:hypothetical protein
VNLKVWSLYPVHSKLTFFVLQAVLQEITNTLKLRNINQSSFDLDNIMAGAGIRLPGSLSYYYECAVVQIS